MLNTRVSFSSVLIVSFVQANGSILRDDGRFQIHDETSDLCLALQTEKLYQAYDASAPDGQAFVPYAQFEICDDNDKNQWFQYDNKTLSANDKCLTALPLASWAHPILSGCDTGEGYSAL